MNTHAPHALLQTSQGDVAHEVPTHGKQQGAHGKIGSAGFAQILGEQVTKSTPKAQAAEVASEQFLPQAVPQASTHATAQSSPESLPPTTPQSLKAAHEKPAPRVIAQVRPEGNKQTPPTSAPALPEARQRLAYGEHRTSSSTQQVYLEKPGQKIPVEPSTGLPTTMQHTEKPQVTPETRRPEHQSAAIPSARAGNPVDKSTSKTEGRVQRTLAANAEAPSPKTAQVTVPHDKARPAQDQPSTIRVLGPAPDPTGHISSVSSQPARMPARSDRAFANQGQNTAGMTTLEGAPSPPAMVRAEQSSAVPHTTPVNTLAGLFPPHTTSVTRGADSHAHIPSQHAPVATQANRTPTHVPSAESTQTVRVSVDEAEHLSRVATKASETAVPLPAQTSNIVAHVTSRKPGDSETPLPSRLGQSAAPIPSRSSESVPPTTLPLPSPRAVGQANAAKHTPISPDANATPAHVQKPLSQAVGSQVLPVPPAISPSVQQAIPAPVPQNLPATQAARDPKSERLAFRPTATATAKVALAAPTTDHALASVRQEDEPAESITATRPARPSLRQSGNAECQATDTPPVKQSPASPTPAASQGRNRSTAPLETAAEKRRFKVEDDKESVEALAAPATSSQAIPLLATSSPTLGIENKPPRSEALRSAAHKTIADTAQTSSAPSTPGQPHATGPVFAPVVLSSPEQPATFALPLTFIPASGEASVQEASAPSPPAAERAGLVDRAIADPGLSVTVMPHSAHLTIASDAGDLALHVRVRDGSADVNMSGTMAPLFDAKAPEVRTVLAGEGLQLGSFATDQRGNSQSQQGNPESAPRTNDLPPPQPRRNNTSTPEVQIVDDRRIHVTA